MPKPFQFRLGSIIYFQGDIADKVFIVQTGKVSLVYQDIETGEDVRDQVLTGEFFGVKSALGRYPREENAVAMADSTIMAFTVPEFEALAMANTRIIMKMLKVFSNQLRRVHKQVASLMEKEEVKPDEGLYNAGEYYLKAKRFSHAKYVFSRYLTYYPSGEKAAQAAKNLELAESALKSGGGGKFPAQSAAQVPAAAAPEKQSDTAKMYFDAVSLISQEKYQQAYTEFKKILDGNGDIEWKARSSFELGRCLFFLNRYEESIKHFTAMLGQFPKHPDLPDAMFFVGQSNERLGRKDQAAAIYKKIISMPSGDDSVPITKAKRALEALGA